MAWFDNVWTALLTAIVTNIWLGVPFMMVTLLGGMQTISGELYEAATIDGATAVAAVRARHAARPAVGQHDGDPAGHDLDVQHVPGDLPGHPGAAGRADRDPGDRRVPGGVQRHPQLLARVDVRRADPVDPAGVLDGLPPGAAQAGRGVVT